MSGRRIDLQHTAAAVFLPALAAALALGAEMTLSAAGTAAPPPRGEVMSLHLISSAFAHQGSIPARYSCEVHGREISPPLAWSGVPAGAKSLALVVDDPDAPDPQAPQRTWVHWVLYDLPPAAGGLPEGVEPERLPAGTRQGANDWGRTGYGAPCPPVGRHRYFFKLYALDTVLSDLGKPDKQRLEQAMQRHVLAKAELIGTYQKGG
jgi:Raf kinase inhibitor-like YbhB/YbcL family protein